MTARTVLAALTVACALTSCGNDDPSPPPSAAPDRDQPEKTVQYLTQIRQQTDLTERAWPDEHLLAVGRQVCDQDTATLPATDRIYDANQIDDDARPFITNAAHLYLCPT